MKGKNLTALGWDQGESLFLLLFVQFLLPLQFLLWSKAVLSLIFCHFCWLKCPSPPCPALSHAYSWTLLRATRKVLLSQLSRHWNLEIYRAKSNFIASIWSGDCVDEEYSEGQNMKRKEKGNYSQNTCFMPYVLTYYAILTITIVTIRRIILIL